MLFKNDNLKIYIVVFFAALFLVFLYIVYMAFYNNKSKPESAKFTYENNANLTFPDITLLEDGDLIFRRGYGVDSTVAMNFSQGEKRYSHAGIVYKDDTKIYIIHSQDDDKSMQNGVFAEEIHDFLDDIPIWAVYRLDANNALRKKVAHYAMTIKMKGVAFDGDFNLKDDQKMYCSEFVYKSINRATNQDIIRAGKRFMSKDFVTISDLYENSYTILMQSSHKKIKIKD